MNTLVEHSQAYATEAHERIDHRRKYSNQPYHEHLKAVAELVAGVTDDQEMIAAAWLHDTLEDTPATFGQIEQEFGSPVAKLVEELTDVSKPSDGNRAARKQIDCQHMAAASDRAQTIKLADLIDNCVDIVRNDPRFAKVYLSEMGDLLEVLTRGDGQLLQRARKTHAQSMMQLKKAAAKKQETNQIQADDLPFSGASASQFKRLFTGIFTAKDIAEPLLSFDHSTPAQEIAAALESRDDDVASIRQMGSVTGYVRRGDLQTGQRQWQPRDFTDDQVVNSTSTMADVIHVLTRYDHCFIALLGEVSGVIKRDDINKPMVRMWLFGIITMFEMTMVEMIERHFPDDSWHERISRARLSKAMQIQSERLRRNQHARLIDCLQLADKGTILIGFPPTLAKLGFESRRSAKPALRNVQSLRNNLAHAQDIVAHDWVQIVRMTQRLQTLGNG